MTVPPRRGRGDLDALIVVIPAHNEETLLRRCLESVEAARSVAVAAHSGLIVVVVVALDACTDASATIAASFARVIRAPLRAHNVGAARSYAVDVGAWALRGLNRDSARVWVAVTDADCVVPPSWLTEQVRLARAGFDLVVGTVSPDDDLDAVTRHRWHDQHQLVEGHPYIHGANLGVRLSTYSRVGGFPALPVHEDVHLVTAIRAMGVRTVATASTHVVTSGRRQGRVDGGFATYLQAQSS